MPTYTNKWTTRIADGDPEPTAEHTRDTLACYQYLSIGHAGGQVSFSYLTLDFLLLTLIQLLGRSGRGRKATRRRLCTLHTVFHTKRGNNCVFDSLLDFVISTVISVFSAIIKRGW